MTFHMEGAAVSSVLPMRALMPSLVLALASLLPVLLVTDITETAGFYVLALVNAVFYTALFWVILVHHWRENPWRERTVSVSEIFQLGAALLLAGLVCIAVWHRSAQGVYAITAGLGPVQVVDTRFVVSGAGSGEPGSLTFVFDFDWDWERGFTADAPNQGGD